MSLVFNSMMTGLNTGLWVHSIGTPRAQHYIYIPTLNQFAGATSWNIVLPFIYFCPTPLLPSFSLTHTHLTVPQKTHSPFLSFLSIPWAKRHECTVSLCLPLQMCCWIPLTKILILFYASEFLFVSLLLDFFCNVTV